MKSNKQRRTEIKKHRAVRAAKVIALAEDERQKELSTEGVACDPEQLVPYNSYGLPKFVERGYYLDLLFKCRDCQQQEIWPAAQQKWWYEVAKGKVWSRAIRCTACRRLERERKAQAQCAKPKGLSQ